MDGEKGAGSGPFFVQNGAPMILYRAPLLDSPSLGELRFIEDGGLLVDEGGRIEAAGSFAQLAARPDVAQVDLRPHWILPGLVDLHVHLPQYEAVAMDGLELLPWLETHIFPAEMAFRDPALAARRAGRFFADLLAWGTTTAVTYVTIHAEATAAAFGAAEACGIRAVLGKVMMDRNAPPELTEATATSLQESEALIRAWDGRDGGRLRYALTPRFAPSCSPELLRGAGALSEQYGCYVQTHLSENLDELRWVRELFPEAASYTDVYRRSGLLHARSLFGHGIHLDVAERGLLREAGATIVHCPTSNAFLKSGIMPARRWLDEGLSVGLGTDVGAGTSLSLWSEAAMACTVSKLRWAEAHHRDPQADLSADKPLGPTEAFHLATAAGGRALGAPVGRLEAGLEADFLVVDPMVVDPAERTMDPAERVLARLLYRSDPRMVKATLVRGRPCHGILPGR